MQDKGYLSKVYLCKSILVPTFCLLYDHKNSLREGFMAVLIFSEVSAFCKIKEALGGLLSASVESQNSISQNNS